MTSTKTKKPAPKRSGTVDPRIRERRRTVKRHEGRRRLRVIGALAVVTVLVIMVMGALNSPLADVDQVMVEGAIRTDVSAVVEASGIEKGLPLLDLDTEGSAASIAALAWVDTVEIDRRFNGDVLISITEREPVAAFRAGDQLVLVDQSGRQLDLVDSWPDGFLPVAGIEADGRLGQPAPPEAHAVVRLASQLPSDLAADVNQIVFDAGSLYLDLVEGGRVRLGDDTALQDKVISLETLLAKVDMRCLYEIDVRVPSAPAIRRLNAEGIPGAPVADLVTCE